MVDHSAGVVKARCDCLDTGLEPLNLDWNCAGNPGAIAELAIVVLAPAEGRAFTSAQL